MQQRLSIKNIFAMGFMAFAMFLGAGNLIFPPLAGQMAGENVWVAAIGFLISGVGLPLLGVIVISKLGGINTLTRELPKTLVRVFGSTIFLIIVPLYGVPRTALVAYEIGIVPFLDRPDYLPRLLFSLAFFLPAWYLSLRPGKLLEIIGELITPALILLLTILGISPLIAPLGSTGPALGSYEHSALLTGFLDGYMTMDALAALMFGIVFITNLKSHGITDGNSLFKYSVLTGVIAACGLAMVYLSFFYLGATSREIIPVADNGGQILTLYVDILFGTSGNLLLAAVVILACFTTAIGLITAAGEYFDGLIKPLNYTSIVGLISICCIMLANLELTQIITLFVPVLMILYPVCILLILLGLIRDWLPNCVLTYRTSLAITLLVSIADVMQNVDSALAKILMIPFNFLPGFESHLGWVLPALILLIFTVILGFIYPEKSAPHNGNYPSKPTNQCHPEG